MQITTFMFVMLSSILRGSTNRKRSSRLLAEALTERKSINVYSDHASLDKKLLRGKKSTWLDIRARITLISSVDVSTIDSITDDRRPRRRDRYVVCSHYFLSVIEHSITNSQMFIFVAFHWVNPVECFRWRSQTKHQFPLSDKQAENMFHINMRQHT